MPNYEPDKWNDKDSGGNVQASSNCYDYAIDKPRKDRPPNLEQGKTAGSTPGLKHNKQPPMFPWFFTCKQMFDGTVADGLKASSKDAKCDDGCWKVALLLHPYMDPKDNTKQATDPTSGDPLFDNFHFVREDSPGHWSHKPGNGQATNKDDDGKEITDPEKAKLHGYTICAYFCVCPKEVEIAYVPSPVGEQYVARRDVAAVLTLRVSTGTPDPQWLLDFAQTAVIANKLATLPPARGSVPEGMGYRGFLLAQDGRAAGLPLLAYVGGGIVQTWDGERLASYRDTKGLEPWLLSLANACSHRSGLDEAAEAVGVSRIQSRRPVAKRLRKPSAAKKPPSGPRKRR